MVFFVGQSLGRANHDGVAGVDADGVQVFHVADGDGRVVFVADDLVLDLLEALDALFNQHLVHRGEGEAVSEHCDKFFLIVREAAAGSAEGKCRAKHDGVTDFRSNADTVRFVGGDVRGKHGLAELLAELLEQLAVLRALDGRGVGAEKLHAAFREDAFLLQLHRKVKTGLTADAGQKSVRALVADDLCDKFKRQRFHVDLVRDGGVGHDGCGVTVAEDDLVALFLQGEAGLGSRVVKFGGLSDDNRAGADD